MAKIPPGSARTVYILKGRHSWCLNSQGVLSKNPCEWVSFLSMTEAILFSLGVKDSVTAHPVTESDLNDRRRRYLTRQMQVASTRPF